MPPERRTGHRTARWPPALALAPLGLLGAAVWFGRWVRPGADDWCFLPVVRDDGVSALVGKFYLADNGRVANGVLTGLYAGFGVAGHQWYALISTVLVLGVLWAVTVSALGRARLTAPRGVPLLVAAMVTAVFLLATPNTYKAFYWPASSVSHTVAPVLACAAAIPLLRARSRGARKAAVATVFVAGAVLGTLSEGVSVVVLVTLASALVAGHRILTGRRRTALRIWCAAGVLGTALGTLVLVLSPGSRARRESHGVRGVSLLAPDSLAGSLRAFAHILATVLTSWPYLGAVAAGLLLGLLVTGTDGRPRNVPPHPATLFGTGVVALLLSGWLCTLLAYPVFGAGVAKVSRTWNDFLLLYLALLVGAGALLGGALRARRRTGAAGGVLACAAVCLALALPLVRLEDTMRARALAWDHQDRRLRSGAALGAHVLPYRPLPISGMREPFADHGRKVWPAKCVARYYRIDRITDADRALPPPRTQRSIRALPAQE
ncbi:DUF6056 family protein [Streptomyces corynorhini]|uniref:Uncharacterized protein n=1 Tax=Streptomyces corynorhini TaxID=2282652 RepID=A0A370B6E8_9ACTN|nr:DUF6056 family protein [Streptomyces corynorhini]RDG37388.1 hypothetical protein DVH02_14585 [Streptomyces corynorhini]